ncbi:MAG: tRNA epoxyqueuosine(34) reductase QueG [Phycisphaerae bacterium]
MTPQEIRERLIMVASEEGIHGVGITSARPIGRGEFLRDWLAKGYAGEMSYLHRYADLRVDPQRLLDGAKSVVVFAQNYHQPTPSSSSESSQTGRVAKYAWGRDYHKVLKRAIFRVADRLHREIDMPFETRVCVDTAPILEREFAARAGVGWIGKNTLVMNQTLGSYFFLGEMITTLALPVDAPAEDHCGTCTACLDACPTDAFPAPYQMDASRCISYLTIEHRDAIAPRLAQAMGDWVFGCDICQEVCPHNRRIPSTDVSDYAVRDPGPRPNLDDIEHWNADDYDRMTAGSASRRATLEMWKRNARIAQANKQAP